MVLQSWSDRRGDKSQGVALQANYSHSTQRSTQSAQFEHYDPDFAMDTAFYTRVGFTSGWGYVDYNIDPDKTKYPWVHRISPFTFLQRAQRSDSTGRRAHERDRCADCLHAPGILPYRRSLRSGTVGRSRVPGPACALLRIRAAVPVAAGQRLVREWQRNLLRSRAIRTPDATIRSTSASHSSRPAGSPRISGTPTKSFIGRMTGGWCMTSTSSIRRTTYQFTRFVFVRGTRAVRQLTRSGPDRLSSRPTRCARGRCCMRATDRSSSGGLIWMAPGRPASAPTSRRGADCSSKRRISTGSEAALHGRRQPC